MIFSNLYSKRSQDLPEIYNDADQFYWAKTNTWLKSNKILRINQHLSRCQVKM